METACTGRYKSIVIVHIGILFSQYASFSQLTMILQGNRWSVAVYLQPTQRGPPIFARYRSCVYPEPRRGFQSIHWRGGTQSWVWCVLRQSSVANRRRVGRSARGESALSRAECTHSDLRSRRTGSEDGWIRVLFVQTAAGNVPQELLYAWRTLQLCRVSWTKRCMTFRFNEENLNLTKYLKCLFNFSTNNCGKKCYW